MFLTIGERMMSIRESVGLSQEELAPSLGMSRSNLSSIEINRISPTLHTICTFCLLFDVYVDWLVLGIGDDPDSQMIKASFYWWKEKRSSFDDPDPKKLIKEDDVKEYLRIFAARLKACRKIEKLSQKDVVNITNIAQSSYTLIEKAKSNVSAEILKKLLTGLKLSGDWLLFAIRPYQKGVIFPKDSFYRENNGDKIEDSYQQRLQQARDAKENNVYVIRDIQRTKLIPFNNLSDDQLQIITNLIAEFEGKNDEDK